ncbi:hypothetical protein ACSBR1_040159 [Camellia fascicularis]
MEKKLVDSLKLAKSWDVIVVVILCLRESYKESVYPVPSSERFDLDGAGSSIIKPPITKKQPRRNKKKRILSRDYFREPYKESVYPVRSSERFDLDGAGSSIIKPPITKKQPGRNKKG